MKKLPLHYQTITDLADSLRKGEITSTHLMEKLLDRIDSLDGQLNAFKLTGQPSRFQHGRQAMARGSGKMLHTSRHGSNCPEPSCCSTAFAGLAGRVQE